MAQEVAAAARTRSPNYPSMGLREAVEYIRTIHSSQRRYPASREVLVKLMGYKSLSGAAATAVSSLSKYGLIEGHGDSLRVSELGQDLALHRKGDKEYADALAIAGSRPAFFRQLDTDFPDGLPAEHSIQAYLVKQGFNDRAISLALKPYRDTKDFLRSDLNDNNGDDSSGNGNDRVEDALDGKGDGFGYRGSTSNNGGASGQAITLPLGLERWAEIRVPIPMSSLEFEQLIAVLEALRPSLVSSSGGTTPGPDKAATGERRGEA